MSSRLLAPALLVLALTSATGCPDPDEDGGDDELGETEDTGETSTTDSDSDSTETDSTDSDSTDSESTDTTDTEGELGQHGVIKVELNAADPSVFEGTDQITVVVSYGACLQDFYLSQHPELAGDQAEGAAVFAAWMSELCDPARENNIACSVTAIEQSLIEAVEVYTLKVTYAITDPAALHDRYVYVGPVPLLEAVDCQVPYVELSPNDVDGFAQGGQLWTNPTAPATNTAIADQSAPLPVDIVAQN